MRPMQHHLVRPRLALAAAVPDAGDGLRGQHPGGDARCPPPRSTTAAQAGPLGSLAKPQRFARRTVRTVRGVTASRVHAGRGATNTTGYWVPWATGHRAVPASSRDVPLPAASASGPVRHLDAGSLRRPEHLRQARCPRPPGTRCGFKVFSYNGRLNWTGPTYPSTRGSGPAWTATHQLAPRGQRADAAAADRRAAGSHRGDLVASTSWPPAPAPCRGAPAPRASSPQFNRTGSLRRGHAEGLATARPEWMAGLGPTSSLTWPTGCAPAGGPCADGRNWDYTMGLRAARTRRRRVPDLLQDLGVAAGVQRCPDDARAGQRADLRDQRRPMGLLDQAGQHRGLPADQGVRRLNAHLMTNIGRRVRAGPGQAVPEVGSARGGGRAAGGRGWRRRGCVGVRS